MRGRIVKIQTFFFSLLATISIFVSPIAACACSHHSAPKTEIESISCHAHPPEKLSEASANQEQDAICENGCVCMQSAPRNFVKSETDKSDALTATVSPTDLRGLNHFNREIQTEFYFVKPFYLSDSFYNLSPGRAPPVS